MTPSDHHEIAPWYKQFWPWFLIALLASSVMFSLTYLTLSIRFFDGSVPDDYYKEGLAINAQLEKQQRAEALGLAASLRVDDLTGDINVDLRGGEYPDQLVLALIFPTDGDRDRHLTLSHTRDGHYVGNLEKALNYRWYLQLQPSEGNDAAWRLTGEAEFPIDSAIALTPGL